MYSAKRLITALLVAFAIAGCADKDSMAKQVHDDTIFCTQDAMECPDGRFVGRSGPKCEFDCKQK